MEMAAPPTVGVDPRGMAMAVAMGASTAFLSPLGHPANLLVMEPVGGTSVRRLHASRFAAHPVIVHCAAWKFGGVWGDWIAPCGSLIFTFTTSAARHSGAVSRPTP